MRREVFDVRHGVNHERRVAVPAAIAMDVVNVAVVNVIRLERLLIEIGFALVGGIGDDGTKWVEAARLFDDFGKLFPLLQIFVVTQEHLVADSP